MDRVLVEATGPVAPHGLTQGTPLLKWVGGKGGILPQLMSLLPNDVYRRKYYEPFVGGGAVFFAIANGRSAVLNDNNTHLIETYRAVKRFPEDVICDLKTLAEGHAQGGQEHYLKVRDEWNSVFHHQSRRAAMFIYFNRTGYNGLWRENKQGKMNVPPGKYKNPTICDEARIYAASRALAKTQLYAVDFYAAVADAEPSSFIYFDPPYWPLTETADFTAYTKDGFGEADQRRLAELFRALTDKGVKVMLSNSDTPFVHELYAGFDFTKVYAKRAINSDATKRGAISELVIRNYKE